MPEEGTPKRKRRQARLRSRAAPQAEAAPAGKRDARKRRAARRRRAAGKAATPDEREGDKVGHQAPEAVAPVRNAARQQLIDNLKRWPGPMYAQGFPFILLWSPKSGCTTLVKWFFYQTGLTDTAMAYDAWPHRYRDDVLQGAPDYREATADLLLKRDRPVIKLVRDPWQRAVSSYLQLCLSLRPGRDTWASKHVRQLKHRIGVVGSYDTISFREFARAMAQDVTHRRQLNPHLAGQYAEGEDRFDVRPIKLENFESEIRKVEAEFGLARAPIDDLTKSGHHRGVKRRKLPGAADIQAGLRTFGRQDAPAYESFYDAETGALIATAFARDFAQYGYDASRIPGVRSKRRAA